MRMPLIATLLLLCLPSACKRSSHEAASPVSPQSIQGQITDDALEIDASSAPVSHFLEGQAAQEGDMLAWRLQLQGGRCYFVGAGGDKSLDDLLLQLWEPGGKDPVADDRGDEPRLKFCPDRSASYDLTAEAMDGHGRYFVGIYGSRGGGSPVRATPLPVAPHKGAPAAAKAPSPAAGREPD